MRMILIHTPYIHMTRKIFLLSLVFLLTACQQNTPEVNVYSARQEALIKPLLDAFTAETGIKVNIISSKADALLQRIQSEGANSPADVLLTTDAGRLYRAKSAGVFAPILSDTLNENIPENYRDSENTWFGLSVRARPIMVTDKFSALELTDYEQLADSKLSGSVCIRSSGNIYNQSLVASISEQAGEPAAEEWARGLVSNLARKPQGGDRDQIRAAAAGQCTVVVANTYYLANMLADADKPDDYNAASKMKIIWPNQDSRGVHVNVSGAGVLKTAPNKDNGVKFIEFLSSQQAQQIYADVNFEYPVKASVKVNAILSQWGDFKADALPLEKLGNRNSDAVKLMDRAGWK